MKKPRTSAKPRLVGVERAYRAASIFLGETGAFRLSVAIFGHPGRLVHWVGKLTAELETKGVHLTQCRIPEVDHPRLLDEITTHLREVPTLPNHTRAVVVTGIGRHLPDAATEHHPGDPAPPFLAEANLDRELFPVRCPHPLLLCVTPTAYSRFRRHAPDLMQWCSHTFDFSETALPDGSQRIRGVAELQDSGPGTIYANRDEMTRAAGIFRTGLDAAIAAYGPDHRETIGVRANLANVLNQLGRSKEALALARENLRVVKNTEGGSDAEIAQHSVQLAYFLHTLGQYVEAEPLMREALRIDRAAYGEDHPKVAIDLNNLASMLHATNRLSEAEPLIRDALRIGRAAYGEDHPNVAIRLNNLAQLLQAKNRLSEAEPLMREALRIDRAAYGEDHAVVARDLNNLAGLLRNTNRLSEAVPLMREALRICHTGLGPEHPNTKMSARNLEYLLAEIAKGASRD